jgi:uncharacterized membrane protein YgcG
MAILSFIDAEEIAEYNVTVRVESSGELSIDENILYDFGEESGKHGIYRYIPKNVRVDADSIPIDIGLHDISAQLDDGLVITEKKSIYIPSIGESLLIKIGDPSRLISGKHLYTIHYRVMKGVLPAPYEGDSIRWNAIGTGWKVPILKARMEVILPKELDRRSVSVTSYAGTFGSSERLASDPVWSGDRRFHITMENIASHEGWTLDMRYPEGLLSQTGKENISHSTMGEILGRWPIPAYLLFYLLLYLFAKRNGAIDESISANPQYYPPDGINLFRASLVYKRYVDKNDLSAGIMEMAQKGYMTIYNDSMTANPFVRATDKSTDDLDPEQRYITNHLLFYGKNIFVFGKIKDSVARRVEDTLSHIEKLLYGWAVKQGYMKESPEISRKRFLILSIPPALAILALSIYSSVLIMGEEITINMLVLSILATIGVVTFERYRRANAHFAMIMIVLVTVTTAILYLPGIIKGIPTPGEIFRTPLFAVPFLYYLIFRFYRKVGPYTQKGLRLYRYMVGYREFLSRVERERIRYFLKEDPQYLDKNLPYAMLFGIAKHWADFYTELDIETPEWYRGSILAIDRFGDMVLVSEGELEKIEDDSGLFSGGGSFTGGGAGGGGGGSW